MTEPAREQIIRNAYAGFSSTWDWRQGEKLCVPAPHRVTPFVPGEADIAEAKIDVLEYTLETGWIDGRPGFRVMCEGVVVDQWLERT